MLLAIDVGTTTTHLGLFQGERLLESSAFETSSGSTWEADFARSFATAADRHQALTAIAVASVVSSARGALLEVCEQQLRLPPEFVGESLPIPIPVRYDPPASAGADRLANAVAASQRYGAPAAVFDFGTATTVDVVAADGAFVGGIILPGLSLALHALRERAPHLPSVGTIMEEVPERVPLIGGSTGDCLRSGLYNGAVAQVEGLARRLRDELGQETPIVATGGLSHLFERQSRLFTAIDRELTLHGIRMIWEASHSNR